VRSFIKIFKFVLPYKFFLIIATFFTILFSLCNGLTLYSIVPIFDSIVDDQKSLIFSISEEDLKLIQKKDLSIIERIRTIPTQARLLFNPYFLSKTREEIITIVSLAIIILVFLRGIFIFIARFLFTYVGNRVVFNIRKKIFTHLLNLPYEYFHKSRSGELVSRMSRDIIPLTSAVSSEIYNFISGIVLLITNITIILFLSWEFVFLILFLGPLVSFPIGVIGNKVKKMTGKIQMGFADLSTHLQEIFSGIKVVKSFGAELFESERFRGINDIIFRRDLKRRIYQNLNPAIVEFLGSIVVIVLFLFGGYQIIMGDITSGEFIFFILLILNLFEPIKKISTSINSMKAAEAASERILEILNIPPEINNSDTNGKIISAIQFKDVSFKYRDEFILKNLNILIPKGKKVAIVGASGSGKSTILNMIPAFYYPSSGNVLIDGCSTADISLDWIRKNTAMITQEVFLFNGTILENITCGIDYEMERVINASKISYAHEFITKLTRGYETVVGDRGILLSGGEKQRISIARAITNNPEILLFDEATSALDSESEKVIQNSLKYLFKNRTSVIVSHRISTIMDADIIYLIKNGEVNDHGTHLELLSRSESYRSLFSF